MRNPKSSSLLLTQFSIETKRLIWAGAFQRRKMRETLDFLCNTLCLLHASCIVICPDGLLTVCGVLILHLLRGHARIYLPDFTGIRQNSVLAVPHARVVRFTFSMDLSRLTGRA